MESDASSFPPELLETAQPVIGFTGLDITKNAVHKTIWDAFNTNRKTDRPSILFKIIQPNYEFPVAKPKHQSYEWNYPKGVLKRNWIKKHLHILPAVLVLFQDIEWNDPQWTEKQYQCASLMQSLKNALQGRKTKLVIVLVQKDSPRQQGEDPLSAERAGNLSSVCDINQKMIFVLPYNDHLMGYTLRLESAFLEMCQTYYSDMSKQVRVHRDQLTNAHQSLKVRHQFKLGFISEMKLDLSTALKHYTQAYTNLDEIRIVETNCLEIKTVAGFINYKICRLMFKTGQPREAITHFKNHIDKYRDRPGFQELIFEHYSWLSIQYSAFAELFCDAIKCGLPAIQTQHPGIYYYKAADYTGQRKEAFLRCCELLPPGQQSPQKEDLVAKYSSILYSEFVGVRGNSRTNDPTAEQQIFAAIKEIEKSVNHSSIIITLLGQAMAQYKIYKCPRYRKKLAIDMADEYLKCGEHAKALTLYSLMLSDYRSEKWFNIFTEVLLKTLRSAFLSSSVPDFIECSVEALSNNIAMENADRIIVLENLWKVFHCVPPIAPSQIAPELKRNWEVALTSFTKTITIDLDKITTIFDCSVTFEKPQIRQNEVVRVNAFITSTSTVSLKLRDFAIYLTDSSSSFKLTASYYVQLNDKELHTISKDPNDLIEDASRHKSFDGIFMLEPNLHYKICFESQPNQFAESLELQITKFQVLMGTSKNYIILTQSSTLNRASCFKNFDPKKDCLENLNAYKSCYVVPIFHLTTQNNLHNQPMLVNEFFEVITTITNGFDIALENVGLSITVPESLRNKVFISSTLSKGRQRLLSQIQMDLGDVQMQSNSSVSYYIHSLVEGNIELIQKIWYQTENIQGPIAPNESNPSSIENSPIFSSSNVANTIVKKGQQRQTHNIHIEYITDGVKKTKEDIVIIPCIDEFKLSGKFYTLSKQALTKAFRNEDFLFRMDIEVKAPCDIDILDMFLISDHNISQRSYSKQAKKLAKYSRGQKIRDVIILRAHQTTVDWISSKDLLDEQKNGPFTKAKVSEKSLTHDYTLKSVSRKPQYKSPDNLLSKVPINATVTSGGTILKSGGSTPSTPLNQSISEDIGQIKSDTIEVLSMSSSNLSLSKVAGDGANANVLTSSILTTKNIYNNAMDAFHLTDHCKGFLNKDCISTLMGNAGNNLGVYCIRWRRSGNTAENETKLLVNGIDIVEAPLNIYCYLDEKVYVKMPMTLTITLQNTSSSTLHLKSYLRNADNFMFAGNTQLNLSIFAGSQYNLTFNLYPLKAGWQSLPAFELKYSIPEDTVSQSNDEQLYNNHELQNLVNRWMPKKIYIIPMVRNLK